MKVYTCSLTGIEFQVNRAKVQSPPVCPEVTDFINYAREHKNEERAMSILADAVRQGGESHEIMRYAYTKLISD